MILLYKKLLELASYLSEFFNSNYLIFPNKEYFFYLMKAINHNLTELKTKVAAIEPLLNQNTFVVLEEQQCNERKLIIALTHRLYILLKKQKLWQSNDFLITLKNAKYGFNHNNPRSRGGKDGIFLVEKNFKPRNKMIDKLYDRFIEKPNSGINEIASSLGTTSKNLKAVRLVSHHMRLLGLLFIKENEDWIVLIDYDKTK
jgi:hypothetical protein